MSELSFEDLDKGVVDIEGGPFWKWIMTDVYRGAEEPVYELYLDMVEAMKNDRLATISDLLDILWNDFTSF